MYANCTCLVSRILVKQSFQPHLSLLPPLLSLFPQVLSIHPSVGYIQPGQSCASHITFCSHSSPAVYDTDIICKVCDWTVSLGVRPIHTTSFVLLFKLLQLFCCIGNELCWLQCICIHVIVSDVTHTVAHSIILLFML